ncbi:MAG: flippase-like domain-containing protein [Chloroflexi bacterium]|nr:flippase-like domain-containing protein [Chloroflexota bacterium]
MKLERLLSPRVVISVVCGAVALALLLSFADIRKVALAFSRFPPILIPIILGLIVARELIRTGEWHYLLHALGFRPMWRHSLMSLLSGDASQILPAGVYFQNYLLQQAEGASMATSLAATFGMQLLEAALALLGLIVFTVPGWLWLRPVGIVVAAGYVVFLFVISREPVVRWLEARAKTRRHTGWLLDQLGHFLEGIEALLRPGVIWRASLFSAGYLAFSVAAFYVVLQAYGEPQIGLQQATAVYCFVLAMVILVPLPSDLGLSEGSGVAALLAYGVPLAQGVTIMLITRFAALVFTELLAGVTLLVLHEHLGQRGAAGLAGEGRLASG